MKRTFLLMTTAAAALALVAACNQKSPPTAEVSRPEAAKSQAAQTLAQQQPDASQKTGKVIEAMNSGGYTYVQVDTGSEKIWAATPEFSVKVGDSVVIPEGMPMYNFHSTTLNRTFEMVYFVPAISVGGADAGLKAGAMGQTMPQMPPGHPPTGAKATVDLSGIPKAQGGLTISELFAGKNELSGKEVLLRGKVVKFLAEIMGKNWIHVQDGTGSQGTNDLTVTVAPHIVAKVGDTVLVKGIVTTQKDFGYGYKYDVILEDAQVTVE